MNHIYIAFTYKRKSKIKTMRAFGSSTLSMPPAPALCLQHFLYNGLSSLNRTVGHICYVLRPTGDYIYYISTDKMSIAAIIGPKIKHFDGEYIKVQVSFAL
jgi:hypothetical protein